MTYVYAPKWNTTNYNVPITYKDDGALAFIKNNIMNKWTICRAPQNHSLNEHICYVAFEHEEDAVAFKLGY